MSRDTSGKSFVSVNSISTSEGWRLPAYLGTQGKAQLEQLFGVLREELAICGSSKEVDKLSKTADRIISGGNSDNFSIGGRVAYRFREACRAICNSSSYTALDNHHLLAFRKVLKCEVRRRHAEIAGWDEKDAEEMALVTDMLDRDLQQRPLVKHRSRAAAKARLKLIPLIRESPEEEFVPLETTVSPMKAVASRPLQSKIQLPSLLASTREDSDAEDAPPPSKKQKDTLGHQDASAERMPIMEKRDSEKRDLQEKASGGKIADEEEKWRKVYMAVKEDTGIHIEDVSRALGLVGFLKPDRSWIDEVFKTITKFVSINEDEWVRFLRGYIARQHQAYSQAFDRCDDDCSGEVEIQELVSLLKSFGIEPLSHVLQEVLHEVDSDDTGSLDLDEFGVVMEILRVREGFSKSEYEELVALFKKFDRDSSGEISTGEMAAVVGWLGYAFDFKKVETIVKAVDFDDSGQLNQSEFLSCMRSMRESELTSIRRTMDKTDADGNGLIGLGELRTLFAGLGYNVDMEAMVEAGQDAGVITGPIRRPGRKSLASLSATDLSACSSAQLDLSKLWQLLVVYRSREGFSVHESEDIGSAFERYDKEDAGEISSLETGKMLRWLGYTPPFGMQQQLLRRVDVDNSGELSLSEFRKLVRMLQAKEMEFVCEAFHHRDKSRRGVLTMDEARMALRDSGCMDTKGITPTIPDEDLVVAADLVNDENTHLDREATEPTQKYVTMDGFIRVANRFNKAARRAFRENSGFSHQEIENMKEAFGHYDRDGSGDITSDELVRLIEDILPDISHDAAMRPKLANLMSEIDADSSGSLDFHDFLRLMQQLNELKMQERIHKEHRAAQEAKYSQKEVEEFRELFLAKEESGYLEFAMLQQMLSSICPLGDKNLAELTAIVHTVVTRSQPEDLTQPSVDFPEFMKVMRKLLDTNFAGMRTKLGGDVVAPAS